MRQEFLLFAERAEAIGAKIFIHGGAVDRHFVPRSAPTPIQLMGDIAVGILTEWAETNRGHVMAIRMVDEDEKQIWGMEAQLEVGRPPGAKSGQHFRQLLTIRGPFPVPARGAYKIVLELDGKAQDPPFRLWVEDMPA